MADLLTTTKVRWARPMSEMALQLDLTSKEDDQVALLHQPTTQSLQATKEASQVWFLLATSAASLRNP